MGGMEFVAVGQPHATRFTVHILAAVAKHEAAMISARTNATLAAAKARDVKLGGWRGYQLDRKAGGAAATAKADACATSLCPIVAPVRDRGLSLRRIAAELTLQGIKTAMGGQWTAAAIRSVRQRLSPMQTPALMPSQ
jgi:DNA invertase Pin-like site-specific DNA recombinase